MGKSQEWKMNQRKISVTPEPLSMLKFSIRLFIVLITFSGIINFSCIRENDISNKRFRLTVVEKQKISIIHKRSGKQFEFVPRFRILFRTDDPLMAFRPANIANVPYNVVTWLSLPEQETSRLSDQEWDKTQQGDGFDARILAAGSTNRTAELFLAGHPTDLVPIKTELTDSALVFYYLPEDSSRFRAWLTLREDGYPELTYEFVPAREGYYSIGFTGAPSFEIKNIQEIWQPMIWQEKRFPDKSYLTLAFQCPLPATLVGAADHTFGVVADPSEYPFDPLPLAENSRFGVALRNEEGKAQPMLFAPAMGGFGSAMKTGAPFRFRMQLFLDDSDLLTAYKKLAGEVYHFADYRSNGPHQLNRTLDNMIGYGMSHWSYFIDSLKGCAYSTDVPGAVKNVSSLNPLEIALITDSRDIYEKRAYPIMEYLLSREKFLFSLDKEQKIQNPSRKLDGPSAPVSELAALYSVTNGTSKALLTIAEKEFQGERVRNLDKTEKGNRWQNALALYQSTGDTSFLNLAVDGARLYIQNRMDQPSDNFEDPDAELFFWTGFVPDYIGLFQLWEETGDGKFLEAAHRSALRYAQFVWFSPAIPDREVLVNKGGEAPHYWYLKSKGHPPMKAPEESVPAWRLSEIGLTPESSGTCSGHRAIFMANHAPWMYRIGYHTNDKFLVDIARSAVVGRYSNFPGYHINTARSTVYEKPDYPLQPYKQLSVNSFHFNHVWPHASILMDYMVTDVFARSKGEISFPSGFIEGYAYLQSKFYGHKPGTFYGKKVWLWMPMHMMNLSSEEINYLSARSEKGLHIAFTNQTRETQRFTFRLNNSIIGNRTALKAQIRMNNGRPRKITLENGVTILEIAPEGIIAIDLEEIDIQPVFQHLVLGERDKSTTGLHYQELEFGKARAMILNMGRNLKTAYIYLKEDDESFREVRLNYSINGGPVHEIPDKHYPYEFTVALEDDSVIGFTITGIRNNGAMECSEKITMGP
jgi:hypothetical protein